MRIEMCPTVIFDDIEAELGFHFEDFYFTQEVENGTYAFFALDEDAIAEHEENIADCEKFNDCDTAYYRCMKNELQLIKYFNNLGYNDAILICVCW